MITRSACPLPPDMCVDAPRSRPLRQRLSIRPGKMLPKKHLPAADLPDCLDGKLPVAELPVGQNHGCRPFSGPVTGHDHREGFRMPGRLRSVGFGKAKQSALLFPQPGDLRRLRRPVQPYP